MNINLYLELILLILYKVVILTLIFEIWSVGQTIMCITIDRNSYIIGCIRVLFQSFDPIITALTVYLMVEHNESEYTKIRSCCCLKKK